MNNITLNWSQEDRLRIDKLIGLLEQVVVAAEAANVIERVTVDEDLNIPGQLTFDETVAETPAEAPEPVEQEQTPQEPETAQDEPQAVENEPTVTKQDILQKVIALCGVGKKAEAKDIITTYADSVSDLPESALIEVWDKLIALEG